VERTTLTARIDAATLPGVIASLRTRTDAVVAFDADGTLWSGDSAEDVFHAAIKDRLLRTEALGPLQAIAREYALPSSNDANTLAAAIFSAYAQGCFPERVVVEVMTWCFAGWSVHQLADYSRCVLGQCRIEQRLNQELLPVIEALRAQGIRAVVVSASPRTIVEQAAVHLGFAARDLAASTPLIEGGRILPHMERATPYAEVKCAAARELFGEAEWLASFGDNVFDIEMLLAAKLGIAVCPKPALLSRLAQLPGVLLFSSSSG
jgi:phosphatidylglycerophosphatase C